MKESLVMWVKNFVFERSKGPGLNTTEQESQRMALPLMRAVTVTIPATVLVKLVVKLSLVVSAVTL